MVTQRRSVGGAWLLATALLLALHGADGLSLRQPNAAPLADDSLEFLDSIHAPSDETRLGELSDQDAAIAAEMAAAGDPEAMCLMGSLCEAGLGGAARNETAAAEWYERSALGGDLGGAYNLAALYARGSGVARDFSESSRWFRAAAEQLCDVNGYVARSFASSLLLDGVELRCERDPDDPRMLTRLIRADDSAVAWDASAPDAMEELAALSQRAEIVVGGANEGEAEDALVLAWGRNAPVDVDGILPHADEHNTAEVSLMEGLAIIGGRNGEMEPEEALAGLLLTFMLHRGEQSPEDTRKAWEEEEIWVEGVKRLAQRAQEGSGAHAALLGALYRAGNGVKEDLPEAARLFALAADKGVASAMTNLGAMAEHGIGLPKDLSAARKWYEAASKAGCATGAANLGAMLHRGRGPAGVDRGIELTSARRLYEKAAALGDGAAMNNLGVMHARGEGGKKDAVAARRWLRRAVEVPSGVFVSTRKYMTNHFPMADIAHVADIVPTLKAKPAADLSDAPGRDSNKEALFNLGLLAQLGLGQKAAPREAARWFALATEKALRDAAHAYGAIM